MKNWVVASVIFILLSFGCQEKAPPGKPLKVKKEAGAGAEIDIQKVEASTGIAFKILKTETVGYMPRHKFFWVCLPEKANQDKIEQLASAIIKEAIRANPAFFHSFTIHFFFEPEMMRTIEASKPIARATFLPEGSWVKVGRVPINDYKDYVLTCALLE